VPTRPNYSSQQAAPIPADGRGGKQDDVAGVSVEELRDGGARMEQAANDGSSSTSMVITGLHMVAFDGSGVVLFKTKGASDRALPAKNERRRWCGGSSLWKWRRQLQQTDAVRHGVELGCSPAPAAPVKANGEWRLSASSHINANGIKLRTGEVATLTSFGTGRRRHSSGFRSSAPGGVVVGLRIGPTAHGSTPAQLSSALPGGDGAEWLSIQAVGAPLRLGGGGMGGRGVRGGGDQQRC
jgi:hypothetical protein